MIFLLNLYDFDLLDVHAAFERARDLEDGRVCSVRSSTGRTLSLMSYAYSGDQSCGKIVY